MYRNLILLIFLLGFTSALSARVQLEQDNPAQFISYWKSSVISSDQDESVQFAQQIFKRLLRGWESSRLEPGLYVVESDQGAWAVSLVDGNILLSRQAIHRVLNFGKDRAEHLMAFVLAHELAHQQSDDLWQHRFFRHTLNQAENDNSFVDLQMDKRELQQMERQEAQADYDGLILMASVGFNPQYIVGKKDFFTQWVENIWQKPCATQHDELLSEACLQAKNRAQSTRTQLKSVADQSSLYQLGVEAMVASDFQKARYYFSLYGRDFPGRAVMSAIGSTHLAEAIALRRRLIQIGALQQADFYFPLILDAKAGLESIDDSAKPAKRAGANEVLSLRQDLQQHVAKAVHYFEKAIRLAPENKKTFQQLISAYLVGDNTPMARGILQGRYIPQFGDDMSAALLIALTHSLEGDQQIALKKLKDLSSHYLDTRSSHAIQDNVLLYATFYNSAALLRFTQNENQVIESWKKLARLSQNSANASLFRLALAQIKPAATVSGAELTVAPGVNGLRLGNRKTRDDSAHTIHELWIEGDQYHVYQYENGAQFITGLDGRIISASQQFGQAAIGKLKIGDDAERALVALGLPDRQLYLASGEFLAYDNYGLALHVEHNQVKGWFLY